MKSPRTIPYTHLMYKYTVQIYTVCRTYIHSHHIYAYIYGVTHTCVFFYMALADSSRVAQEHNGEIRLHWAHWARLSYTTLCTLSTLSTIVIHYTVHTEHTEHDCLHYTEYTEHDRHTLHWAHWAHWARSSYTTLSTLSTLGTIVIHYTEHTEHTEHDRHTLHWAHWARSSYTTLSTVVPVPKSPQTGLSTYFKFPYTSSECKSSPCQKSPQTGRSTHSKSPYTSSECKSSPCQSHPKRDFLLIPNPLYLIWMQDTRLSTYTIDICKKSGILECCVGPGAYFAHTLAGKRCIYELALTNLCFRI
jgi:hypothetical protein